MNPLLSIVIPAYNEEKYLLDALYSIKDQTYDHEAMEVVVVNNASTDRTAEVFAAFIRHNELRIRMTLVEEKVLGVSRAKNKGAAAARGDILLFLDADSEMSPNLAEMVARYYRQGFKMGIIRLVPKSSAWLARNFFRLIEFGKRTFRIASQMGYCDRQLFWEEGGFDPKIKLSEDLDLFTRIKKRLQRQGKEFAYISEAWIRTSTRRMDHFPYKIGYFLIFSQWFLSFIGLGRDQYKAYR